MEVEEEEEPKGIEACVSRLLQETCRLGHVMNDRYAKQNFCFHQQEEKRRDKEGGQSGGRGSLGMCAVGHM